MEKQEIIIDVEAEEMVKTPLQKHKEDLFAGIDMGFDFVERGLEVMGRLAKSVGIGR